MKKRIIALILCALMITAFTACGKDKASTDNAQNNTDASTENSTDASDAKDNTNETDNTKKEGNNNGTDTQKNNPDSARDTVLASLPDNSSIYSSVDDSKYFIFTTQNGEDVSYGIVDIDGNIIVEPSYSLLGWCPEHKVIYAEPFSENSSPVVLDKNYKIDLHYGHGAWGFYQYLFEASSEKFFRYYFDFDTVTVTEISEIEPLVPYVVYGEDSVPMKDGEYSLFDPIYDTLSEIAFGDAGAEYEFITDKGGTANLGNCTSVATHFANDYLLVYRNGKAGYVNGIAHECSQFEYDSAMPAYDGKAWVLHEGVWKVIKLK